VAARYEMACTAAAKYCPVGVAMPLASAAAVHDKSGLVIVQIIAGFQQSTGI
jgi:hypothetical protein